MVRFLHIAVASVALLLGILAVIDLRWTENVSDHTKVNQAAVTLFYDQFGGILMNDMYHYLFEYAAMKDMITQCDFQVGDNIVEIGTGSGFLADKIIHQLNELIKKSTEKESEEKRSSLYFGIDVSSTMYEKASKQVKSHFISHQLDSRLTKVQMNLVSNSLEFTKQNISFPVDKFILTYVMDLMPQEDLQQFVNVFHSKLRSKSSKVCVVNLTYGFTPLSRIITNLWQVLYVTLGSHVVGGCRPLNILEYFNEQTGFQVIYKNNIVSTSLPSEVAIISKMH